MGIYKASVNKSPLAISPVKSGCDLLRVRKSIGTGIVRYGQPARTFPILVQIPTWKLQAAVIDKILVLAMAMGVSTKAPAPKR